MRGDCEQVCFCENKYVSKYDSDSFFFFKQKTAYEIRLSLVGSEMCIRDRTYPPKNAPKGFPIPPTIAAANMGSILLK